MNHYEAKQAERKARLQAKADQARQQSVVVYGSAREMASGIPFGQPILVGHHSERRDRNHRARITRTFEKSFELQSKAEHFAQKAAAVGHGGISSDDPDAIEKLKVQLAQREAAQEFMKKVNALLRRHARADRQSQVEALVASELVDESRAQQLVSPDYAGRTGFASYQLQNNNANIRRIASRIKSLEQLANRPEVERSGQAYVYREDPHANRAMFIFAAKPDKQTRDMLKRYSFKWSPARNAWVRQLTNNAQWAARQVIELFDAADQ